MAASAVGFATFVVVTRGLGVAEFGAFTAALVFLFIPVVLADVGLSTALLREISAAPERMQHSVGASLPLRFFVSTAALGVALPVALLIPLGDDTQRLILIGSVGGLLTLMSMSLLPVLEAGLRLHWAALGTVTGRIMTLALTLAFLEVGFGLDSVMWAHVIGTGVTFVVHALVVGRTVSLRPRIDPRYWRGLLQGSIAVGLAGAFAQIYFRVDMLLVEVFRRSAEVGLYGAAVKFIEVSMFVGTAIGMSFFPVLVRLSRAEPERARRFFRQTIDVLVAVNIPLVVLFGLRPYDIVVFVSGEEFREAGDALRILAPYVLLSAAAGLLWRTLVAANADVRLLVVISCALVLNVALNVAVIPTFGFRAAAVTAVATELLVVVTLLLLAYRRYGFAPGLPSGPGIGAAAAAMAVVLVVVPGPVPLAAAAAGAVYVAVLALAPGTARDAAVRAVPALRRAVTARTR